LTNKTNYENPFYALYLAEEFVRNAEDIIGKRLLSPEMFKISELVSLITDPFNHFILGVPGSGKTMAIAFLRVECLSCIAQNERIKKEFESIWSNIPQGLWGIYHGLLMNEESLSPGDFRGFGIESSHWTSIFGDFINAVYLKRMLDHLAYAPDHHIPKWIGISGKRELLEQAVKEFAIELQLPPACYELHGCSDWVRERIKLYQRLIKHNISSIIKTEDLPKSHFFREVGYVPMQFVNKLKKYGVINKEQKVVFMLDEYDQCSLAKRDDFARSINSFVKNTARGSITNLYVIIGSRPHGFHDKNILDGEAKIEYGRDYKEIDLMKVLRKEHKLFSDLIKDIANRRLQGVPWFQERGIDNLSELLDALDPVEEAKLYRASKTDQDMHFKALKDQCARYPESEKLFEELIQLIKDSVHETLYQKYLIIEICRRLQRLRKAKATDLNQGLADMIKHLKRMIDFILSGAKARSDSKMYYKLKDMREPALFLLASDFRQQKYYCGLDTITLMSEGVPLNFIKLAQSIFDEVTYRLEKFEKTKKIDIVWQNRAIRRTAEFNRKDLLGYISSGQSFLTLLDELGFIFRRLQLSPTAPYPSLNGFSIELETGWTSNQDEALSRMNALDEVAYLREMVRDATDWGYLIEMPHRSKVLSLKTRTKYYISSMFSPYYDLSVRHLKEPLYIKVRDLLRLSAIDTTVRAETRRAIIGRSKTLEPVGLDQNTSQTSGKLF
jgi:hypothetical protein